MTEVKPPKTLQETLYDKYIDKTAEYRTKGLKAGASYGAAILDIKEKDKKAINKLKKRKKTKSDLKSDFPLLMMNKVFLKPKPTRKPQTLDKIEFLKPRNKRNKPQNLIT